MSDEDRIRELPFPAAGPPADADAGTTTAAPEGFADVGAAAEVAPGAMKGFDVAGERVVVAHVEGRFCAIGGICTHQIAYLEDGLLESDRILCPRHGAAFELATGAPLTAPADMPVPVYDVCVVAGRLLVSLKPR